jgi:hypothetical protein
MKPLPDRNELRIFWTVATSTAIETGDPPYELFARSLYHHLAGTYDHIKLKRVSFEDEQ